MSTLFETETLRNMRLDGRLIPFVGAGLSIPLGLPSSSKLIDIIAEQLGYDPEVYRLNGTDLQLAEYYNVPAANASWSLAAKPVAVAMPEKRCFQARCSGVRRQQRAL